MALCTCFYKYFAVFSLVLYPRLMTDSSQQHRNEQNMSQNMTSNTNKINKNDTGKLIVHNSTLHM